MQRSWLFALEKYDAAIAGGHDGLRPFRGLVADLAQCAAMDGMTAVTSHFTLLVSPFSCYPDWFDRRHLRLTASAEGTVLVEWFPDGPDQKQAWALSLEDARQKALDLAALL